MAESACGLTLTSAFTYRGATEKYSNQYWFTGAAPADSTAWKALADAVIAIQKTVVPATVSVWSALGHVDPDPHAVNVWSYDYAGAGQNVNGTLATTGGVQMPGDAAVFARWRTQRLNTKGKPVYLRKYFHGALATTGNSDTILPAQRTALLALATNLTTGFMSGARSICSPLHNDDVIAAVGASYYITTRTLKRRGKRPTS